MDIPSLPRGEGTISYSEERNKYVYRKSLVDTNGRKKRVYVYADTPKQCMEEMRKKELEIERTTYKRDNMTLVNKMLWWCDNVHKPTVKPQTNDRLRKTIVNQVGNSKLAKIAYRNVNSDDIQELITDLNNKRYSYSVIKKTYDALRAFFKYISLKEHFDDPMNFVVMPRQSNTSSETRKIEWFEQEDIDKFIKACDSRWNTGRLRFKYGYVLAANIYLGLRVGELLALQWKDVDWDNNTITVWKTVVEINNPDYDPEKNTKKVKFVVQESTKTDSRRIVPMNKNARQYLLKHKDESNFTEDNDFIISTYNGNVSTAKNISDMIKAIEEYGDTTVRSNNTHILRHTCASLYFKKGVPVEMIAKILGNSREVCEQTYVHFAEEQLKIASAKLGEELLSIYGTS